MKPIGLKIKNNLYFTPTAPFNFDAVLHKPSHFPSSDNIWEKGKYWITMLWQNKVLGLKFENKGTIFKPKVKVIVYSQKDLGKNYSKSLKQEINWRFNFNSNTSEFYKKFKNDKLLKPVLKKWKDMRPVAANSFYETLIIYIVLQNATVKRTVQMLENLFNKFGQKIKFDNKILSTFWQPEKIDKTDERVLRDLKLGYRAKFVKKLSSQFVNGKINEFEMRKLPKNELEKKILKIYGIGPASVEYVLFEDYYHNVFKTIPPWEQKIYSRIFYDKKFVPVDKILKDIHKKYGEWSKLVAHYIWEDLFWTRKHKHIEWLEKEIRL